MIVQGAVFLKYSTEPLFLRRGPSLNGEDANILDTLFSSYTIQITVVNSVKYTN